MDLADLRARAAEEANELGPEPLDAREHGAWTEERRGAVELLAALAGWDQALLRRATLEIAYEWADRSATQLLIDTADTTERATH